MSTFTPAAEMQRFLVNTLRADAGLSDTTSGLLFPTSSPQVAAGDLRVYAASVMLPGTAEWVSILPRVLIETIDRAHDFEQDVPLLTGPVRVFTFTVVRPEDEELGQRIDAYLRGLIPSTWVSDARIIAARLALDGDRRRERIPVFNGAWQFVSGYSSANAESLL